MNCPAMRGFQQAWGKHSFFNVCDAVRISSLFNLMRWATTSKEASMARVLITLCCLLTMGTPVFADSAAALSEATLTGNDAKAAAIAENESAEEESFQDLVQT